MSKYTDQLITNGQSFREFAFLCARKLSPFMFMKDRPHNEEPPKEISGVAPQIELDYGKAEVLVKELSEIDPKDVEKYVAKRIKKAKSQSERDIKLVDQEIKRLMDMQANVLDWIPGGVIMSLRQIMLSEVSDALVVANKRKTKLYMSMKGDIVPEKYFQSLIEKASRDLAATQSKLDAGEQERINYKIWYTNLIDSLPK